MSVDLNKIKARLGSITGQTIPQPLRASANKLLFEDLPALIEEVSELRLELQLAKAERNNLRRILKCEEKKVPHGG